MRHPSSRDLSPLGQLTRMRELSAIADLARLVEQKCKIELAINDLKAPPQTPIDSDAAANLSRWMEWRKQEIGRLSQELAITTARLTTQAETCGKAMAENAVMEKLINAALISESEKRGGQAILQQSLEVVTPRHSHFLADNFGDKDI